MPRTKKAPSPTSTLLLLVRHGQTPTTGDKLPGRAKGLHLAEKGNEQVPGPLTFDAGAISYSATLTGVQGWAGTAVRYYAPNNTGSAPATAFDASSFTKLKIQLKSTTDALLQIKLQPSPVAADGCTATASAVVSSTLTELVIDLNEASFPLPGHCAAGTAIAAVKAGLYAVDVVNVGVSAGTHDLTVGTVKLAD